MIRKITKTKEAARLFEGWAETLIYSCLQGIMGEIYGAGGECCTSAMAVIGDFCFFAGRPNSELAGFRPETYKMRQFIIMVPQSEEWSSVIESVYGNRAVKRIRYATKKENAFDNAKLRAASENLPEGFELRMIDEALYRQCAENEWSRDLVSLFRSYEDYGRLGLGVVAVKDGEILSGASSYSRYEGGIEIEIDTREDYRRRGFAYACGARLIAECIERGLYPSWDAQNKWSLALAEKLGYRFDCEYPVYEVYGY